MSAEEEKKEEPTKVADAEVRSPHWQASDSARSRAHSMWAGIMLERPDGVSQDSKTAAPAQAPVEEKETKEVKVVKRPDEVRDTRCASVSC